MRHLKLLAIIGAEYQEIKELLDLLEERREEQHGDRTFYLGKIKGQAIVVLECGVGKVNAARGTQMLIDFYEPDAIINIGVGGGLAPGQEVGDAVFGERLVQHDFDLSSLGFARGQLIGFGNEKKATYFHGNDELLQLLEDAWHEVKPQQKVCRGCIASGDVFVASRELKEMLHEQFGADAAEMEGAVIAYVATMAKIPFAVVRVLSDLADGSAPESHVSFAAEVVHTATLTIQCLCEQLTKER